MQIMLIERIVIAMKRISVICIVAVGLLVAVFTTAYLVGRDSWDNDISDTRKDIPSLVEANVTEEVLVTDKSRVTIEKCDMITGQVESAAVITPAEYYGMNRTALINHLRDEVINMSMEDKINGLISIELIEFEPSNVLIRKTYSKKYLPEDYYIYEKNGYLAIYLDKKNTMYDMTDIAVDSLDDDLKNRAYEGIHLESLDELYSFLQSVSA